MTAPGLFRSNVECKTLPAGRQVVNGEFKIMSGRYAKIFRKYVKEKYRADLTNLLEIICSEGILIRLRYALKIIFKRYNKKAKTENENVQNGRRNNKKK